MADALFAQFEAATHDDWLQAARESLRGRRLDSLTSYSYEGIDIAPLLDAEDLADAALHDGLPSQFPFRRGTHAAGYRGRPWLIANEIDICEPAAYNQAMREALAGGQTAVVIGDAPRLESAADLMRALDQIDLRRYPLIVSSDSRAPRLYQWLRSSLSEAELAQLKGVAAYDPLSQLARRGWLDADAYDRLAGHIESVAELSPGLGSLAASTTVYHDAGAHAVQELAYALASGVDMLRELAGRGLDAHLAARKLHFRLGIGEDFCMEIAKFRAIKQLWAQAARAIGIDDEGQRVALHARSGGRSLSRRQAHVNLPRLTIAALAAVIGGVDCLSVAAFDAPLGQSSAFSRRLSRGLQLILSEELRLPELVDPAGGAWHIERLSDELSRQAWREFQAIEAAGGMLSALNAGMIQRQIAAVAERRRGDVAAGDAILVGVNRYVDGDEQLPDTPASKTKAPADAAIVAEPLPPLRLEDAAR